MTNYSGNTDTKWGFGGQIGLNFEIPINNYLSIMPEVIFSYKTTKVKDIISFPLDESHNNMKDKMYHMNVPVSLKIGTPLGIGRIFISVGPMLNVGLYGKSGSEDTNVWLFQADPDFTEQYSLYNIIDFSGLFKAGYDFDFGLSVSAAFQLGFLNVFSKDYFREKLDLIEVPTRKTRTVSVSLGYNF
jgi:hypothetical protein